MLAVLLTGCDEVLSVVTEEKDGAFEISFFYSGYKYTVFSSMDSLINMFENFGE